MKTILLTVKTPVEAKFLWNLLDLTCEFYEGAKVDKSYLTQDIEVFLEEEEGKEEVGK